MNDAEILHFNLETRCKILHSHFPAKFIPKSTTKILHNHISAKFIKKSTTNR